MSEPHVIILGAGPAGLGAAFELSRRKAARVTVVEKEESVGGSAASFEIFGVHVDYGSHRLHPSCNPEILDDIKTLLGADLLDRPRHGRIRLRDRWIHFPLKPFDLALRLPLGFSMGAAIDLIRKNRKENLKNHSSETFASVLEAGLGRTVCRDFYFPYAHKIWGIPPEEMSAIQALRRVSANSSKKILLKILNATPGFKPPGSGRFFYPRHGFGQISEHLYQAAEGEGVKFFLGTQAKTIDMSNQRTGKVYCERNGEDFTMTGDYVWSTIPVTELLASIRPSPPDLIFEASQEIQYRAMILIYLVLEKPRFSEYDAHYFPSLDIPITRLSEPKNYSGASEPLTRTVLCAELPCFSTDPEWSFSDGELEKLVCDSLHAAGIPVLAPVLETTTRRLGFAYPIYGEDYEAHFEQIDQWLAGVENLLSFGRQGLFVHDNTHHALFMGYAAARCLKDNGSFSLKRWEKFIKIFDTHVVED